ncbi:hypothetical protein ABTF40_11125 [Acinetobacter baumannii]
MNFQIVTLGYTDTVQLIFEMATNGYFLAVVSQTNSMLYLQFNWGRW